MLHDIPELLLQRGLLSDAQLRRLREVEAAEPDLRVDQILLRHGLVAEEDLLKALADLMGFEYLEPGSLEPAKEALAKTPAKFVFKHKVLPVVLAEGCLVVATSEPFEILALDELEALTGLVVEPAFAGSREIAKQIKNHFGVGGETIGDLVQQEGGPASDDDLDGDGDDLAESASVIRLVNEILADAVRERASDVHIEPDEVGLQIRCRIDGVLQLQAVPPEIHRFKAAIVSRLKIMARLNIAEKRKPQDGRIKLRVDDREVDLRVSIIPMLYGEGVVLRILDKSKMTYDLRRIGLNEETYAGFNKLIRLPHGIILVTGPTGSGKSTTLYSALAEIKDHATKIITVEDPVEYQMPGISQIQVNHKVGLDFAAGLRSILRHDPDVILIGEIRDFETAQIAIQAAMTGHLVFSTLHTNDAPSAFPRMIDMGVEPYLVSSSVMGVMAQRLVRRVCQACAQPFEPDPLELPRDFADWRQATLLRGAGCEQCRQTGYSGRLGIYELLTVSPGVQRLVIGRADATAIKTQALQEGMKTLRHAGWERVSAGVTTIEEVLRVTKEEEMEPAAPAARPRKSVGNAPSILPFHH